MKNLKYLFLISFVSIFINVFGQQGLTCDDALPFCTDSVNNFEFNTIGVGQVGPNYGCMGTAPHTRSVVWFYMRIATPGDIDSNKRRVIRFCNPFRSSS